MANVDTSFAYQLRSEGRIMLCVASSGIASLLLDGGRTAHSRFKIPVENLHGESVCGVSKESQLAALYRAADALIWDEAANQHRFAMEAVDRSLRDIRNDPRPFGGLTVVFGGDFQQILPVVVKGSREDIVGASLCRSPLWEHVQILRLTRNMRLEDSDSRETIDFAQFLLDVGHGRTHVDGDHSKVQLPAERCRSSIDELIDSVYDGIRASDAPPPADYFANRTILSARNEDVDDINERMLDRLPGDEYVLHSADSVTLEPGADEDYEPDSQGRNHAYPPEYLRSLKASGLPLGELHLKVGCPVILLRNLAPSQGLCNGTRLIVRRVSDRVLEAQIMGGKYDGDIVLIPRITLNPASSNGDFPFKLSRRQFPVRLAFAMSINKAQGQSVKFVGLDLRIPVFTHGQLYVALSRATSPRNIHILLPSDTVDCVTENVVYPEVLLD